MAGSPRPDNHLLRGKATETPGRCYSMSAILCHGRAHRPAVVIALSEVPNRLRTRSGLRFLGGSRQRNCAPAKLVAERAVEAVAGEPDHGERSFAATDGRTVAAAEGN